MKTPWYLDVFKQAKVLNKVANRYYNNPNFKNILNSTQEKMWNKFDMYQSNLH